jgi:predicted DNA-binding transcriptional regulator YafY
MNENYSYPKGGNQRKQMHYSPNLLSTIQNAIENQRLVVIEYDSKEKGISHRDIEPMAIVYKDRKRHLVGWCRLRDDYRSFRLDRLNAIKLLSEEFQWRNDFAIENFQDDSGNGRNDEFYDEEDEMN